MKTEHRKYRSTRFATSLLASTAAMVLIIAACTSNNGHDEADPDTQAQQQQPTAEPARVRSAQEVSSEVLDAEVVLKERRVLAGQASEASMPMSPAVSFIAPGNVQRFPSEPLDRENYTHFDDNPVKLVSEQPVSTFSVDVDSGAYANLRRMLSAGQLPPADAVRVEEMINYFDYGYAPSRDTDTPFNTVVTLSQAPWDERKGLLRIGLKGFEVEQADRKDANLVFLVDVSGSMHSPDKLDLLKRGLGLLTRQLTKRDRVSLVVYAGASGVVLQPTPGNQSATIRAALSQLQAGGSTNGAAGIRLAYDMARQAYIKDGINRVILATDGDFNVGTVNFEQLVELVERERDSGITLTTLGFGSGNYNDHLMEQLADKGNGNYGYIDSMREAEKLLVRQMTSTLQVIASDVKAQVEFNPAVVSEYRLVGYENRQLAREDFNNDKVDAGDIGAGHSVTALYELVYVDSDARRLEPLRYGSRDDRQARRSTELGFLKLRYKLPGESDSRLLEFALDRDTEVDLQDTDDGFRFATAVAAFGQHLRGGKYLGDYSLDQLRDLARRSRGEDPHGDRGEFLGLVDLAAALDAGRQAGN